MLLGVLLDELLLSFVEEVLGELAVESDIEDSDSVDSDAVDSDTDDSDTVESD